MTEQQARAASFGIKSTGYVFTGTKYKQPGPQWRISTEVPTEVPSVRKCPVRQMYYQALAAAHSRLDRIIRATLMRLNNR